jgi:hypothetical protein
MNNTIKNRKKIRRKGKGGKKFKVQNSKFKGSMVQRSMNME